MKLFSLVFIMSAILMNGSAVDASEFVSYSKDKFVETQKKDKNILLQYHASWCPICKRQRNVLETLTKDPAFSKVEFVAANYDTDKELRVQYAVKRQSTLILFQGEKELKRSQGISDAATLTDFIKQSFTGSPNSEPRK